MHPSNQFRILLHCFGAWTLQFTKTLSRSIIFKRVSQFSMLWTLMRVLSWVMLSERTLSAGCYSTVQFEEGGYLPAISAIWIIGNKLHWSWCPPLHSDISLVAEIVLFLLTDVVLVTWAITYTWPNASSVVCKGMDKSSIQISVHSAPFL